MSDDEKDKKVGLSMRLNLGACMAALQERDAAEARRAAEVAATAAHWVNTVLRALPKLLKRTTPNGGYLVVLKGTSGYRLDSPESVRATHLLAEVTGVSWVVRSSYEGDQAHLAFEVARIDLERAIRAMGALKATRSKRPHRTKKRSSHEGR